MSDTRTYATLRDYLAVLRANRLVVLAAVVVFTAGAVLLTAGQPKQYQAESTVAFRDVQSQIANLVGVSATPTQDAATRAQINAQTLTRPEVVRQVSRLMGGDVPISLLTDNVSASVDNTSGFLVIDADSSDPAFAQRLANAYARAVQIVERRLDHNVFISAAAKLQKLASTPPISINPIEQSAYADRIGRLRFAAETADPVDIATNAALPTTPISPHPVRDGILGLVLGLTVGIAIAFIRDALDRRMRGSRDITGELGWPILGHIREDLLGPPRFISSNGNGHRRLDESELDGFRVLRQNLQFLDLDNAPRSIVVTSAAPEEGKSTIAASLACACALTGKRTLVVDCDLRRPSLAQKFGVAPEPGLTDYLLGEVQSTEILRLIRLGASPATNGHGPSPNGNAPAAQNGYAPAHVAGAQLVCIPAGRRTSYPAELLSSQRLRDFLSEVSSVYDMVVLDSAPILSAADTLELMPEVQGALVCVRASRTKREELRALKDALTRLPSRPTGVVVTGVRAGSESEFGYYSYQYRER
jgi:Mrp family chromosome partitioning ATPase/capsular polysaccharide biosynthesis protein